MTETQNSVRLGEIIKEFHLELLHEGEDYQNIPLRTLDVNRPGLPLSGFFEHFDTKRLLVMGLTETTYVSGMSEERRRESFDRLLSYPVPALIYTRGIDPFPECMEMAQKYGRIRAAHPGADLGFYELSHRQSLQPSGSPDHPVRRDDGDLRRGGCSSRESPAWARAR